MDRKGSGMNRAFSTGGFALTASWGAAPGQGEYRGFGAKHIPSVSQPASTLLVDLDRAWAEIRRLEACAPSQARCLTSVRRDDSALFLREICGPHDHKAARLHPRYRGGIRDRRSRDA